MPSSRVALTLAGPVAHVVLDRPEARNAFDGAMVRELHDAVGAASVRDDIRIIVLAGRGSVFCAGADVEWMKTAAGFTRDENLADAHSLFELFETIDRSPKAVVASVQGAALGGGAGLSAGRPWTPRTRAFAAATAPGAAWSRSRTQASTAASSSSSLTTRWTRPIAAARATPKRSPVRKSSRAAEAPIFRTT